MTDLHALADRVEGAEGADRELDEAIQLAAHPFLAGLPPPAQPFTASLDAALTLGDPDAFWQVGHDCEGPDPSQFKAIVSVPIGGAMALTFRTGTAETAALAMCAARLRAAALRAMAGREGV